MDLVPMLCDVVLCVGCTSYTEHNSTHVRWACV